MRRRTPRARSLLLAALGTLAALLLVPSGSTRTPAQASYIVVLNPGIDPSAFAGNLGATAERTYSAALDGFVAPLSPGQLKKVEIDPVVQTVIPDDASFSFETDGVGTGVERVGGLLSPTAKIDGNDERVGADIAIIDSGIQRDHPDLNVVDGHDCGGTGSTDDFIGHGTAVAGLAAALDDGIGIVGVAPGARLVPVSIADGKGKVRESAVICALDWVTQHADVIEVANMSVGRNGQDSRDCGLNPLGKIRDPLHAAVCAAVDAGVTIVASAGNGGTDAAKQVPAAYDEVITVSAIADSDGLPGGLGLDCAGEQDDTFASFSNYGADVDIAAPGVCLQSTTTDGGYGVFTGTSFSAPLVAGAAALLYAAAAAANDPAPTPEQVKDAILANRAASSIPGDPDGINEGVLKVAGF